MQVAECSPRERRTNPRVDRTGVSGHLKSMTSEHLEESKRSRFYFIYCSSFSSGSHIILKSSKMRKRLREIGDNSAKNMLKKNYQVLVRLSFPGGTSGKEPTCLWKRCKKPEFDPLGLEDPLEKDTATHSSILAWRIPGTEEPGGLQSMGSQRLGHDWSDLACTVRKKQKHQSHILPISCVFFFN